MVQLEKDRKFIYLYPHQDIFDEELRKGAVVSGVADRVADKYGKSHKKEIWKLIIEEYKPYYQQKLNACIHHRYRKKG